jgi:hypothetical protein
MAIHHRMVTIVTAKVTGISGNPESRVIEGV